MQGSIRTLVTSLQSTNDRLKEKLKKETQQRVYLSTNVLDLKMSVREHKKEISKLEKKYNRLKTFRKKKLANFFKLN